MSGVMHTVQLYKAEDFRHKGRSKTDKEMVPSRTGMGHHLLVFRPISVWLMGGGSMGVYVRSTGTQHGTILLGQWPHL